MDPYVDPGIAVRFRGSTNSGIFFRLDQEDSDDVVRLWFGSSDIRARVPGLDPSIPKPIYRGAGQLVGVPEVDILINGKAGRGEFFVNGVSSEFLALVEEAAPSVKGMEVTLGFAALDNDYQADTDIIPIVTGFADFWAPERKTIFGAGNPTHSLKLSVGFGDTARRRPALTSWSSAQQRMISADDEFCDRVARYNQQYTISWPRY